MSHRSRRRFGAAVLAAVGLTAALLVPAGAANAAVSPTAPVVINEVYGGGGNSGAPLNRDFIELYNPGTEPVSLEGWSVQYGSASGITFVSTTALSGSIAPGQHLLIGEAFGTGTSLPGFTADIEGAIAMGAAAGKVALTSTTTTLACATAAACALDPHVVDLVGWGSSVVFAGSAAAPATTSATSVSRGATHANTANNGADFTAGAPTPTRSGAVIDPDPAPDPDLVRPIAEVQGGGAASEFAGDVITTTGVVTAVYPTGGFNGYVIQTAGSGGAVDLATHTASDALFVFSSATVGAVEIGDSVRVKGTVSEFNGLTEITVADAASLTILEDAPAPTPATLPWPASTAQRESLESMLFAPQGAFTVSDTFTTNQYGEVVLASGDTPLRQPTDVARPGSPEAAAVVADNDARKVTLDDGASLNFLSATNSALTPAWVSLVEPVVVGASVTFSAPVIVDYRNDAWKLNPTAQVIGDGTGADPVAFSNPRTAAPEPVGGDLSVASFNVLNYFTTLGADTAGCTSFKDRLGDPVTVDRNCLPRGAWDPDDRQRQQDKIVAAINALDADVVGLMEIENSLVVDGVADEATASLVAALNTAAGSERWAYVPSSTELPAPELMDVITNAIIYQPSAVTRVGESRALGTASADDQAFGNAREPIAQAFVPVGGGETFLFVVNHFKSKGSAGPWPGDKDVLDGQGASNESRVRQATALRDWVASIQGDVASVALAGDFNSYGREDPLQVLYDAGYADAEQSLGVEESSYVFGGLSGSLDHVLLNQPALARATGADIWNINSGESIALEYSRYNYHGTLFYEPNPYRSSDHDPVKVGMDAGAAASATALSLNRTSLVFGAGGSVRAVASVTSAKPPVGTVEFAVDGTVVGAATLKDGTATAQLALPGSLGVGGHEVTARFTGTAEVAPSTSTPVAITVRAAKSSTTLLALPGIHLNRVLPATLAAVVVLETGKPAVGTVEFREGTAVVGTVPVSRGTASLRLPDTLSRGTHRYTATFVPSDPVGFVGSTSGTASVGVIF